MTNNEARLLIVDDDAETRDLLAHYLAKENFRVVTARGGDAVDRILSEQRIHLVLLDLMLPGEDGLSICRRIRAQSAIPIIILTAKGEDIDRIIGLEMGADDYVAKPFNPRELVARIKSVLWRATHAYRNPGWETDVENQKLAFDEWIMDVSARELFDAAGARVPLSSGEFDLLLAFVGNPGRVLSRDQLLDLTQGRAAGPYDRSIDVQVGRLRRRIEADPSDPTRIKTVRGSGYIFTPAIKRL
jgi:two-component system, OmpR family, response regulator